MIVSISDWQFRIDTNATRNHTTKNASDHCECAYCKNYYDSVELMYPELHEFLDKFGVNVYGPSELMPFEPTLVLACYRVHGQILQWGEKPMIIQDIPVLPAADNKESFLLWIGELNLPWVQDVPAEDVVSPANLPEFLERMRQIWLLRHGEEIVFS